MANTTFEVELRAEQQEFFGVMLTEGRAARNLRELFAPGSVTWPSTGVAILTEHLGEPEVRAHPVRTRSGELQLQGQATDGIRQAIAAGKRYMSVEFKSLRETVTAGGIREITSALVDAAALVSSPEYSQTAAEVRGDTLARLLRDLRDERGITTAELGAAGGIDESTMSAILSLGDPEFQIACPPVSRLQGFAEVLNVPLSRIMAAAAADGCEYASEEERASAWL